ncbi:MAG: serine hydrolase domain-containing protein, partial [Streptosporangiales bacterium]
MAVGAPRDLVGRLAAIADELVARETGPTGAVLRVATAESTAVDVAIGARQTHDGESPLAEPLPMTRDTLFDVGSVTKVAVTTCLAMRLHDAGRLGPDDPIARWYAAFGEGVKREVTVRHLLAHRAGLWEWWPTYAFTRDPDHALAYAADLPLRYPPGTARHYSDLGFMLLGGIVEEVAGAGIEEVARRELFAPLGQGGSCFRPGAASGVPVAATSHGDRYERAMLATGDPYPVGVEPGAFAGWRSHTLAGEVNDGNAFHAFGGVAGHAGLFTTASDLTRLGRALLAALHGAG